MKKEAGIKFKCHSIKGEPISWHKLEEIDKWRDKLYKKKLIGAYNNGIGFGNLSIRTKNNKFIITGTATGILPSLNNKHYTEVTKFDIDKNTLTCKGPLKASSESLSHAAIYKSNRDINAIIHIHNLVLWKKMLGDLPTTSKQAAYGSPELAREIIRLLENPEMRSKKIIVMAGHKEGIISFGKNLDEAGSVILKKF